MAWTFLGLTGLISYETYKKQLADRIDSREAEDEDVAQRLTNEADAWERFNEAVDALERDAVDPRDFLDIYREGRKRYHNFYVFRHPPFTLVYYRDPLTRIATPMVFFHHRDRLQRLAELADLLKNP